MEKENKTRNDVKQAAQAGKEEIAKHSLTTKQKMMMGATVVAATGAGFAAGYVVGKRRNKGSEENISTEPKELD